MESIIKWQTGVPKKEGFYILTVKTKDTSEQRVIKFIHENLYESMIKYIKWLIKEDYFNKEYLKQ